MAQQEVVGSCSSPLTPLLPFHPEAEGERVVLHAQMAPLGLYLEQGISELSSQFTVFLEVTHLPASAVLGMREGVHANQFVSFKSSHK